MTDVCLRLFIWRPADPGSADTGAGMIICNAVSEEAIFHVGTFPFDLFAQKKRYLPQGSA